MLRIAIADDHQLFRKSLAHLINSFGGMNVVIEANNGKELLEQLHENIVDIVLLDIQMPEMDGFKTCSNIKLTFPQIKILMLSQLDSSESISKVLKLGANGYFTKNSEPEQLMNAILSVDDKGFYFEQDLGKVLRELMLNTDNKASSLSNILNEREIEIIKLTCRELNNRQIAEKLFISPRTVEGYKARMIEKLQVNGFIGVILYACKTGIVSLEEL